MKLFNKNHYPVLEEGVHFDFYYALPKENVFSITIKPYDIKIEPTTKHSDTFYTELTDEEKQRLFDIVVKVDLIRMFGKNINILVSLNETKPVLHNLEINKVAADKSKRETLCKECNLIDSAIAYNQTLSEFLRNTRHMYYNYEAVDCSDQKIYTFNLDDVAKYSRAIQDSVKIKYDAPEKKVQERGKNYTFSISDDVPENEYMTLEQIIDEVWKNFEIRGLDDLYRYFPRW